MSASDLVEPVVVPPACLRVRLVAKGDGMNVSTCRSSGAPGGSSADDQKIRITRDRGIQRTTLSILDHAVCAARKKPGVDYILHTFERFICMAISNGLLNGTVQSADCTVYDILIIKDPSSTGAVCILKTFAELAFVFSIELEDIFCS